MPLNPTNYGNGPFQPGMTQSVFVPDQLIAGDLKIVTTMATITGGAFVRGTVMGCVAATGAYTIATAAATDGSATPRRILVDDVDASGGDKSAGLYAMGEFNERAVTLSAGITLAAARDALEAQNIYLKSSVSAADPS